MKIWVPLEITILPSPLITPDKMPVASVMVSVLMPNALVPLPDKVLTLAPELVALMSKLLLLITPLEVAIVPSPDKAKVPAVMVVAPS